LDSINTVDDPEGISKTTVPGGIGARTWSVPANPKALSSTSTHPYLFTNHQVPDFSDFKQLKENPQATALAIFERAIQCSLQPAYFDSESFSSDI
jgi:hypothetical protein